MQNETPTLGQGTAPSLRDSRVAVVPNGENSASVSKLLDYYRRVTNHLSDKKVEEKFEDGKEKS